MEKLKMQSVDGVAKNIEAIGKLFPNAITEVNRNGKVEQAIDFDVLRQELSDTIVEGREERYQFTWPDKKKTMLAANAPISATLRPVKEESVNFDTTENLYIEGDNLEVLKLLQETYLGKVKMIYIDPPYNRGKDLLYKDKYNTSMEVFNEQSNLYDENGNIVFNMKENNESNGKFHTDWLNIVYSRIKLAKNLLSEDGVLFISIDDNECENLRKVCNEIFGKNNAMIPFIWELPRGINAGLVARAHEYILCYTKNSKSLAHFNSLSDEKEYSIERCNKKIDARHPKSQITFSSGIRYEGVDKVITGTIAGSEKMDIIGEMVFENNVLKKPVTVAAGWTMKNMIQEWMKGNTVYDTKGQKIVEFFFKENGKLYSKKEINTLSIKSILHNMPDTQVARQEMEELFNSQDIFPYPKTKELIKLFVQLSTGKYDIVLDFFSGSATTAQGIMELNADQQTERKYILVQIPELTDKKSEAYKAGYKTICEIGKERIRRAAKKIAEEHPEATFDGGFRVLKLDSSNMKDVYYNPAAVTQPSLAGMVDNIKEDRTPEDLLFQVMLDLGVELSSKISVMEIGGKKVFDVAENYLLACFDSAVDSTVVTAMAKKTPYYAVFRDASFADDSMATNFEQIFKTYSPDTKTKVL